MADFSSCISVKKGPYLDVVLNQLIFDMNKHCRSPTHNYNWARTTDFTGCSIAEIPISLIIRTLLRALRPRRALLRLRVSTKSTAEWWRDRQAGALAGLAQGRSTEQLLLLRLIMWKLDCWMEVIHDQSPQILFIARMSMKMPPLGTPGHWEETLPWGLTWALTESLNIGQLLRIFSMTDPTHFCKVFIYLQKTSVWQVKKLPKQFFYWFMISKSLKIELVIFVPFQV